MSQWNFDFLREKRERKTLVSENSQSIYIYIGKHTIEITF